MHCNPLKSAEYEKKEKRIFFLLTWLLQAKLFCSHYRCSKGIGKATALHLVSQGAQIVINYNSDAVSANALVQQIGPDRALAV